MIKVELSDADLFLIGDCLRRHARRQVEAAETGRAAVATPAMRSLAETLEDQAKQAFQLADRLEFAGDEPDDGE